jgi:hypothetical protein
MPKLSSRQLMVADASKTIEKHLKMVWRDLKADLGADDLKASGRHFAFSSDTFKLHCDRDENWELLTELCFCYNENDDDDMWKNYGWEVSFEDEGDEKYCLTLNNANYYCECEGDDDACSNC